MAFVILNTASIVVAILPITDVEAPVQPAGQTAVDVAAVNAGMLGCIYSGGAFIPPPTGNGGFVDPKYASVGGVWVDSRTSAEVQTDLTAAVQKHLDTTAQQRGYDNIVSACSYAASTHTKYGPEGRACLAWREVCWDYCYQVLADVQAGIRAIPTTAGLVAELPAMVWP